MNIGIIGTGYVGLVTGACLAQAGHKVTCADIDKEKIRNLKLGKVSIWEPGLSELVFENVADGRLKFTTDNREAVRGNKAVFLALPTPSSLLGHTDLSALFEAVKDIREELKHSTDTKLIIIKSTVPVGTSTVVENLLLEETDKFHMVSNPEFLREGTAVLDFNLPDRIVVGTKHYSDRRLIDQIYESFDIPIEYTNIPTAELVKYACNAFLATKVAFINDIANLCDKTGAEIEDVSKIMGMDPRIGSGFLKPGPGFGGSCFPKDTRALACFSEMEYDTPQAIVEACISANEQRPSDIFNNKIIPTILPDLKLDNDRFLPHDCLKGKTVGILGVAFKRDTDDVRESPILEIMSALYLWGASIKCYDPQAMENASRIADYVEYCATMEECAADVDALIIGTEWDEFMDVDQLDCHTVIDLRNLLDPDAMYSLGVKYVSIGRR